MTPITWANCQVMLGELQPWTDNPRLSTKAQARRLLESWQRFGQVQTIAIGPGGQVYDGHQRLSALLALHGPAYQVDARRADRELTDEERRALVVTLHAGAVGAWDWDSLSGWDAGMLQEWGFDSDTLTTWQRDVGALGNLLDSEEAESADAEPQIDRAAELNEKWQVKPGDLWRIGEHRLACGDCTDRAVVERVMGGEKAEMVWTDPPYGVAIGDKNKYLNSIARSNRVEDNLVNDTIDESGITALLSTAFDNAVSCCTAGAAWYVAAPAGPLHLLFGAVLKERGIWRQTIQWVKNNSTFSPMGVCYHWQAEPIFFGWIPNGGHRWYGGRQQTTVWNIDRPLMSPEHPTMKPVELVGRAVKNSSQSDELVFDPFLGSGTTLVACQNLHRRGRGIEISPEYCAVTLERMAMAFPGIEIERVA